MPNQTYAQEWLHFAVKNLETARILIREKHYTDSIAIEIHLTIEKAFKAIYAHCGIAIPKTHDLMVLFNLVNEKISLTKFNIDVIITISDYYDSERYPGPRYVIPARNEVEEYFIFTEQLFRKIEQFINSAH